MIYKFEIKPDRKDSFEKSWKDLTHLIYDYSSSLGSRLHKKIIVIILLTHNGQIKKLGRILLINYQRNQMR